MSIRIKDTQDPKTDCFAYRGGCSSPDCIAPTGLYCQAGECAFYKTVEEAKESTWRANERLDRLGVPRRRVRDGVGDREEVG